MNTEWKSITVWFIIIDRQWLCSRFMKMKEFLNLLYDENPSFNCKLQDTTVALNLCSTCYGKASQHQKVCPTI